MTTKVHLSAGDVVAVTGVSMKTLDRWVRAGLLAPANSGRGHGRHRVFSLGDAIAVAAGGRYRAAGADHDRVAGIVKFLSGLGAARLKRELVAGRTFPVPGALIGATWLPGLMIEPPACGLSPDVSLLMRRLDLAAVVAEVRRKVAERCEPEPASN